MGGTGREQGEVYVLRSGDRRCDVGRGSKETQEEGERRGDTRGGGEEGGREGTGDRR